MSYQHVRNVLERSRSRNAARVVLLVLADRADDNGASYPSMASLTREAMVSRNAAHTALQRLVALGELQIDYNAGPQFCNVYRLLLPLPKTGPVPETVPLPKTGQTPPKNCATPLPKTGPKPSGNHQEPSVINKHARASIDECRAFARDAGLPETDGEAFFHTKEENGWRNGPNPVRNAKGTFLNWQRNGWHPSQKDALKPNGHAPYRSQQPTKSKSTRYDF